MSVNQTAAIRSIQTLYLNPNGADVWFIIDGERIPGHKHILGAMCPYYSTMFYGSLPVKDEVDMTASNVSIDSFKEFLKFMYAQEPHLTLDNIEGVISMAKQSLSDEIFAACEEFLKKTLTIDTVFFGYQLALLYDANHLKAICEEEICVNAEKVLKSSSFLEFSYDYLQMVLRCDALACEELDIFNACIAWAKAACKRNNLDVSNGQYLRDQLRDSVYQIRFTSMTKEEAGKCIQSNPGLFTTDELEEIICMVAHHDKFQPKQFNWTPRYFNLEWYKGRHLKLDRVDFYSSGTDYRVDKFEMTRFFCNRRVLLKGFTCEIDQRIQTPIQVTIKEIRGKESCVDRYNQRVIAEFNKCIDYAYYKMLRAEIQLSKAILLRPNYTYEIGITFEPIHSHYRGSSIFRRSNILKTAVRVDHDIKFNFNEKGIVTGLSLGRFDKKNFFQKAICDPHVWISLTLGLVTYFSLRMILPRDICAKAVEVQLPLPEKQLSSTFSSNPLSFIGMGSK